MEPSRTPRFGKPYYRSNYVPPNSRQTLEDRLHPPGISTSSNSSWTFSNSHCDVPKPRKGRLCGIFLIGAALVVALAVIAIGGLAFYIGGYSSEKHHLSEYQTKDHVGAKRQYSNKQGETLQKAVSQYIPNTTRPPPVETHTSQLAHTKGISEGAILGLSETMQQLNKGLHSKKTEETTMTEAVSQMPEYASTEYTFDIEEQNQSDFGKEYIEEIPESSDTYSTTNTNSFKLHESNNANKAEAKYKVVKNGHARPTYSVTTSTPTSAATTDATTSANIQPPKRDYSNEPWRPIIPSYRDAIKIRNPYDEKFSKKVLEHQYDSVGDPVINHDVPITFSRESYEQNLRITPEYTGNKLKFQNNFPSRLSGESAVSFKDSVKDHKIGSSEGIAEIVVTSDDIITAPPIRAADITIVSELSTLSTLSAYYNATENIKTKENAPKNTVYPIGVDQMISGISLIESHVGTSFENKTKPKEEISTTQKTTTIKIKATEKPIETTTQINVTSATKTFKTKSTTAKIIETTVSTISTTNETPTQKTTSSTTTEVVTTLPTSHRFNNLTSSGPTSPVNSQPNITVKNPFLDDSRSSSSNFNFGLPELPILKQFHHLDSLLKSFSKPSGETNNQFNKHFVRSDTGNETTVTRFPVRTKQTTVKSYKKDDAGFVELSTLSPEHKTSPKPVVKRPVFVKGEVEVLPGPTSQMPVKATTEIPKLITLLPVRSNVNMMRPLRPRPKSNLNSTITITDRRKSKMSHEFKKRESTKNQTETFLLPHEQHQFVDDENGKRWIYYSSSKFGGGSSANDEKLFIVTPEPKIDSTEMQKEDESDVFQKNLTDAPLFSKIETLLNLDFRERDSSVQNISAKEIEEKNTKSKGNTSEIVDRIVKIMENVAISAGDSPQVIVKVNQTMVNRTKPAKGKDDSTVSTDILEIPMKVASTHYKLNQAGVPVLTKILNKVQSYKQEKNVTELTVENVMTGETDEDKECNSDSIRCGNGTCLSPAKKCNQFVDCPDAADEKNCTCAEHLKAQKLHRKLCDGVVDCWDFTDEFDCEWCQEEFLCSNSKTCIKKAQICDGINNCPLGDDERNCVTVSPSRAEAETFNYHYNGYLMVRKNGHWGKLCIDNFDSVSFKSKTNWKISDLGRSVCKALTYRDFDKVERMISVPNEGRSVRSHETDKYYELAYNEISNGQHSSRHSVLSFHETDCAKKEVVKVTCTDLECGLRPHAMSRWSRESLATSRSEELIHNNSRHSRIVGGGNAGPGSWPWQAALYKEGEFQCGGTLISENWLISAGHCFYHNQDAYWVARLGSLRTTLLLPSPYEQLRQISKIILHHQYIDNGFINDISLLRMRDAVRFTDYVRPICLPKFDASIIDGTMCTVVGWGQLSEVGWVFPDTLQEVQLPILSSAECRKRTLFLPLYKITDDMFCAGYDRGGRDACLGDSGGPLMCQESDGKWSLYGVTSNGYGCARSNRPGVYTKVSKYLHWIHSQMSLHSESLAPVTENEEKHNPSTSRSFTEDEIEIPEEKKKETDYVFKIISQRVSNVKLSTDSVKSKDKCKGHRCPLGECLPKSSLCNGHIECSDGSDEKDCW